MASTTSLTDQNDKKTGTGADEIIDGKGGNDTIDGAGGNDSLNGGSGNDSLTGGAGNDTLNGGDNNDTAIFSGPLENANGDRLYAFELDEAGRLIVTDLSKKDGVDTLVNMETLKFNGVPKSVDDIVKELDSLPILSIDPPSHSVTEGTGTDPTEVAFTVSLSESSPQPVSVRITTVEGTAKPGSDYVKYQETITFEPGETDYEVTILLAADAIYEGAEAFSLKLDLVDGADIDGDGTATIGIIDDDERDDSHPELKITDQKIVEGDAGSKVVKLDVTLNGSSPEKVTVNYNTLDGSAVAGKDYLSKSGTLTFNPGEVKKTISITINGDTLPEGDENFSVILSSPKGATLADDKAIVTITDNEPAPSAPSFSLKASTASTTEGTAIVFTVTPSAKVLSDTSLTVQLQGAPSATLASASPSDFSPNSTTLTFKAGDTAAKTASILVVNDGLSEGPEGYQAALLDSGFKVLATVGGTIDDPPITLTLAQSADSVDEGGSLAYTLTASNVAPSGGITVPYTLSGTAGNGSDYTGSVASGIFTIPAGATQATLTLAINTDTLNETAETLVITLGAPSSGTLSNNSLAATINNVAANVQAITSSLELSSLNGSNGFRLDGEDEWGMAGWSVSGAGDVNGDGFDDLIVGAPKGGYSYSGGYGYYSYDGAGVAYVVFGQASGFPAELDLGTLNGRNGFKLSGVWENDLAGFSVSAAGDVNGDGFDDLIIGAMESDVSSSYSYSYDQGSSYVVFGKASGFASAIDLASLNGQNGFRLDGVDSDGYSGFSVSTAGDVNGDGFDDLIVGAPDAGYDSFRNYYDSYGAGASYVVFGQADGFSAVVQLDTLNGHNGFKLSGVAEDDFTGFSVSAAGDVNGDGFDDLIVGAPRAGGYTSYYYGSYPGAGVAYVVFGQTSGFPAELDLSTLNGRNGFKLTGEETGDLAGCSVSAAGDVNGDGFDDLIIGAEETDHKGIVDSGSSYVVFGKASGFAPIVDLSSLNGQNGFRLVGAAEDGYSGFSVSTAGDFNGDGFDDLIVGVPGFTHDAFNGLYSSYASYSGMSAAYVVFGQASGFPAELDVSTLNGRNGFKLNGDESSILDGRSVSAAGDVNGDGFDDLIVGAPLASLNGNNYAGSSYVIYGGNITNSVTYLGGSGADNLNKGTAAAERFVAGNGNDSMTGGGGADVFNGGAGNDTITVSDLKFQLVGGNGSDTLALSGASLSLNLASVRGKIENIESINLTGNGNNTLNLTALDVLNLSDSSNRLTVDGNSGDKVTGLASGWTDGGVSGGYHSYTQGQATVQVGVNVATDYSASSGSQSSVTPGQAVIDLGSSYGKLIKPVNVDGHWYYYWDRSGDGTSADIKGAGYINSYDDTNHDVLDQIFTQDINGNTGGGNTDNTYRYATINGVHVALPTIGDGSDTVNGYGYVSGTSIGGNPASSGSTAINPTYNDLLAVWDAYNGIGTETISNGTPPGWYDNNFGYWSATPAAGSGHGYIYLYDGYVSNYNSLDNNNYYVALEVLPSNGNASTSQAVTISGSGASSAAGANVAYTALAGTYAYTISGFGTGDTITFPAGQEPTVINSSFTDGSVDLQWAHASNVITISFTGLSATQDVSLFSVSDFNTLFGPGTVL